MSTAEPVPSTASAPDRSEARARWTARIGLAFALWAVLVVIAFLEGNRPDGLLLGLTVAAFATTLWLFLDAGLHSEAPRWDLADDDPVRPPGEDPRLALLTRVVAQHLDAREVGDVLHRHLCELADQRLMAAHGVSWRVDPDRAAALLGPELVALARQRAPHPRMDPRQIDVLLSRIEAL
ncbi:hypothetical protein KRR39_01510 [Nocardioides panacis]|uniref:Uncharacterized protein n=1 Tax=Nocardioides panacis TaxID=2849501 RepID=A0A975SYZ8_9ACTN|nr:hypothetical protein [Nocardioides panacis]QWZ08578.1 hypothetical protein KRR39_01510 [Nocardioides panacis]